MKLNLKNIAKKLLIISMLTVYLSFFSASSVAEAKITIEDGEFYYTGTQNSEVTWEASAWQKFVKKLSQIANFLMGLMFMAIRSVFVGYIAIMEILLTALLNQKFDFNDYMKNALNGIDTYSQRVVNIEQIIFNEIGIFDIDLFDGDNSNKKSMSDKELEKHEKSLGYKLITEIKKTVAEWYLVLRLIVVAMMLLLLIFIGIKMAISTVASEKAVCKQMLWDWFTGMVIIFSIHYIMAFVVMMNNTIIDSLGTASNSVDISNPSEFGDLGRQKKSKTPSEIEFTLYESARTRAYSMSPLDGFAGMIIYGALVFYAWKFTLIYFKRLLNIMILTIVAPVIAGSYAFNKTLSGGATIYTNWLKEYIINVIIQVFHALIYLVIVSTAFELALESLLGVALAIVVLGLMSQFSDLLRQLFNVSGGTGSLFEEMLSNNNIKSIRSSIKNLPATMFGGSVGLKALKVTGRVATKPIRKGTELAFGGAMIIKAKSKGYKNKQAKKEKKINDLFKEYNSSQDVVAERNRLEKKEEDLYNKRDVIDKQKKLIQKRLDDAKNEGNTEKIDDLTRQLDEKEQEENENEKDIQKINEEINDFENSVQEEFIDYYVRSQSTWETIKSNVFDVLLDPEQYLDKKDISFDEIEKKASKMFKDFDTYKEIIKNDGRTKIEAEMYQEYYEMKKLIDKRASLYNSRKPLDDKKTRLGIENASLQKQLNDAKNINDIDQIKNLQSELDKIKKEIEDNDFELSRIDEDIMQVENEAIEMYADQFADRFKIKKDVFKNNPDILFQKMEEKVQELDELLSLGDEDRKERLQEAREQVEDMRLQAKEALTKYKLKGVKREGGLDKAFWKKKESSVGKIFFDNLKLDKILGIDEAQKKVLKKEFEEVKSSITGTFSGIAGVALLGGSPTVGLALLANSFNNRINTFTKTMTLKNAPSNLKYNYKFKAFGEGTKIALNSSMQREIKFAESKMTRINVSKHPILKKVLNTTEFVAKPFVRGTMIFSGVVLGNHMSTTRLFERENQPYDSIPKSHYTRNLVDYGNFENEKINYAYQKKARKIMKEAKKELLELNTKTFEKEFKTETKKYKKQIADEEKNKSTDELILDEILCSDDVVKIDDNNFIEYNDPDELKIDFEKLDNLSYFSYGTLNNSNSSSTVSNLTPRELRALRVEAISNSIIENKIKCIQIAIFDIALAKKITDIQALELDDRDKVVIRQKIKEMYERKGHLRKGELKINRIIQDKDIDEAMKKLSDGRKKTNNKIADRIVKKACFGYMTKNNLTDPHMLQSSQAKSEIEKMIAEDLMTSSSKSTQNVLYQISENNQAQGPTIPESLFKIDNIEEKVDKASANMKRKSAQQVKASVGKRISRQQLENRSIIRRENQMKSNLEMAIYTSEDTQVADEAQRRMLFLLKELGNQNKVAYRVEGKKAKKTKGQTLDEKIYLQSKIDPDRYANDEYIPMPMDNDLNVLIHGRRDLIDIINNG